MLQDNDLIAEQKVQLKVLFDQAGDIFPYLDKNYNQRKLLYHQIWECKNFHIAAQRDFRLGYTQAKKNIEALRRRLYRIFMKTGDASVYLTFWILKRDTAKIIGARSLAELSAIAAAGYK